MSRPKGSKNKKPVGVETPKTDVPIKVTLKSMGRVFESAGATLEEAIGKIKISGGARALSVLTVNGKDKILNARHTNGLFGQGSYSARQIHLKQIKSILGIL